MRKTNSLGAEPAGHPAPPPIGDAAGVGPGAEALWQQLPWGVVVLDEHGTVLRLNQQAAHWWGAPQQQLQGQQLAQLTAGTLPAVLQDALQQVTGAPARPPGEYFLPQHQQWIAMSSACQGDTWVVYWQDVTAQKHREDHNQARQAATDTLLRRTEAVARTGSYELALATGHVQFSDGLYQLFGEAPGAFGPEWALIDARSHADDAAVVQQVLARAMADGRPYYYQRRIYHPDGQLRTLECHGRVACDALGQPAKLLGLLQDVTEREQAAQELLQAKDELAQRATDNYVALYNSMDEGFCLVEVLFDAAQRPRDYRFLDVNPAFENQSGLYNALGKTIRELVPTIEPLWADVYGRVAQTGEPMRFEANVESMSRWFDINAFPIGPLPNRHVGVLFTDITERKRTEAALRESDAYLRQAVGLAHLGICHWDYQQDVMRGNDERFIMLGLNPAQEVLPVTQAIALTHPHDRPIWASIRQQVEREGEFQATYRIVRPSDGAVRWLSEVGRVVEWQKKQPTHISSVLLDVTTDYEATEALRQSEARQSYLLALSDALQPLVDAVEVQATVTHTARHYFQADRCYFAEVAGDTVTIRHAAAQPGLPSVAAVSSLSGMPLFSAALQGGQPVVIDDADASPLLNDNAKQRCRDSHIRACINVPVRRLGKLVGLLCLTQATPRAWKALEVALVQETAERTWAAVERAHAEEALRRSEEQFRLLVTATSDAVYRMNADWTQMEQLIGKDFLADTQGPGRTWMEEYIPADERPRAEAAIADAIGRKAPFELEHRVRRADGTVGWTYSRAIPVLDARGDVTGWLGAARDVSAPKQAEAQLQALTAGLEQQVAERTRALGESQVRLQSVFDSATTAVVLLQAVRDAQGHLLDFEYLLVNLVAQAQNAEQTLVGRRYGVRHPGVYRTPIFRQFEEVVETGRRADFEVHYAHEGYNHWFRLVGVKLGDGVLFTAEDITVRKLLEQAQAQSFALLQQSEAVASMGSWEYDLRTREFTWSDGLYHLLERPVGSAIQLQFFLDAVLDDDRPAGARLLRTLTTGAASFDTTLRLRIGDAVKTVRFKAVPLPDAPGSPERVLGVCLDVSDVHRLEAENLALKLDRHKELLLAILQAQETERQRLGEVLHNGLGQMLYATKLHLDQLDTPALHALPVLPGVYRQTSRLLADAMRQTRTLAHELVPTSLLDFGLPAAVRDVCRDLSTPQLRIVCHVWGEEITLPQPIQVTLFRLAQELAHNIIRHAGATQATLELEILLGGVSLRAEDNGHGFDPQAVAEGLGLRTTRHAVALLGGTVAVDSSPEFGTHIRLRIPLPLFS